MRMRNVIALVLAVLLCAGSVWAAGQSSGSSKPLTKVNFAIHANGGGASVAVAAINKGYFAEYGIEPNVMIVETGIAEMAAMRADNPTLDIGYIGPGVAWNPIDSSGNQLSFVFFDNLSNSERLIARKGAFTPNASGKFGYPELYAGLRGKTIYLEIGTTNGAWFKNLVTTINAGYAANDRLWIHCEDAAYLAGYTAPNTRPENRILVVNYLTTNLAAGMATTGSGQIDIAVGHEPIPATILRTNSNIEFIGDISLLSKEMVFPGTWVARTRWLESNPELAKNFIYAIYKGAIYRGDNLDEMMRASERYTAKPDGTFLASAYVLPTAADYREWFANPNALGYEYLRSLYNDRVPNIPQGVTPKPFDRAFDLRYMLQAISEIR